MIIIYHCSGGSHSSVLAANIHLGILPTESVPEPATIMEKTVFDTSNKSEWGLIKPVGNDEYNNIVCTLGRNTSKDIVVNALHSFHHIAQVNEELKLVNIHHKVNLLMKIGGFLSRGLGFVTVGRPIVMKGSLMAYSSIAEVVKDVKKNIT